MDITYHDQEMVWASYYSTFRLYCECHLCWLIPVFQYDIKSFFRFSRQPPLTPISPYPVIHSHYGRISPRAFCLLDLVGSSSSSCPRGRRRETASPAEPLGWPPPRDWPSTSPRWDCPRRGRIARKESSRVSSPWVPPQPRCTERSIDTTLGC